MIRKVFKSIVHLLIVASLTLLSQIGGIVYILSLSIAYLWKKKFRFKLISVFAIVYTITTLWIVPVMAPWFGREKVISNENIEAASPFTDILNRNYVSKKMNRYLKKVSDKLALKNPELKMRYLDACFPFYDGFPLLPHLSHNDGHKIDFSLVYENQEGMVVNRSKSISGYGISEGPLGNEFNQINSCLEKGYWQYDMAEYLTFGRINKDLQFSLSGTKALITAFLHTEGLEKVFLEPHLKQRMELRNSKIRFHGCRSVRHDDHIHLQIK